MPGLEAPPEQLCSAPLQDWDFPFQKRKLFETWVVPCIVPGLPLALAGHAPQCSSPPVQVHGPCSGLWHGPTSVWALHFQPLPSFFSVQIEYWGLCREQQHLLFILHVGFSFLSHLTRQQGGWLYCSCQLEVRFLCSKREKKSTDGIVNYLCMFKVMMLSSLLCYNL